MEPHEAIIQPMITEKSTVLQERGKYVFQVALKANKVDIKRAVESTFGVTVVDVNTTSFHGKGKRYGPRIKKMPDIKKAVVTLRRGERIQIIEGV
ncbi:MAG: 50S ribosomal protein L23 [Dehalococcoidia bacterium]|nr:50S ribosomal protein L23 [Dehalococcoidia bacterium]